MDEAERLKEHWREAMDRIGDAGRRWRKSLVARACRAANSESAMPTPEELKHAIKAQRRARAEGHWCFRPERLRMLMALYLQARRRMRRRE